MKESTDKKNQILQQYLPKHIAIVMDGNGRWAKKQNKARTFGHESGVLSVRETVEASADLGIGYLTLYTFSTENWNRPKEEVDALMELLVKNVYAETPTLNKNNIRLQVIGDIESLSADTRLELEKAMENTAANTAMVLILALSYSSRWEITHAVKTMGQAISDGKLKVQDITQDTVSSYLNTANYPDPELLIRTSGELRLSNFLLWQLAYTELYFTNILWPDFKKEDLYDAILDFQKRERRFGKTSEQL